mmetsp:Transcript_57414/g.136467  ORF Transcript_57414/g.136467 Transcript_57414/m.136467 type:complete len:313 (+) Transcript_57414:61-999(+)
MQFKTLVAGACAFCTATQVAGTKAWHSEAQRNPAHMALMTSSEASDQATAMVHELDNLAERVDKILAADGAPPSFRKEENSLLRSARAAAMHGAQSLPSQLRGRQYPLPRFHATTMSRPSQSQRKTGRSQWPVPATTEGHSKIAPVAGSATSLAKEVKTAESLVKAELAAEHAPKTVRDKEEKLLDGAAKIAEKLESHANNTTGHLANTSTLKTSTNATQIEKPNHTVSNITSKLFSSEVLNATERETVFDLRKEHEQLQARNAQLRSENAMLKKYASQEEGKLEEENAQLEDSNAKLERENAKLEGDLATR